jgi:hypothetical protein
MKVAPPVQASLPQRESGWRKVLLDDQSRTINQSAPGLNRLRKDDTQSMSRVIRNTGYVMLAAGSLLILAASLASR